MNNLELEQVKVCFEQRAMMLSEIANLTKQIEIISMNTDTNAGFDDLYTKRGKLMTRIDKCNTLLARLSSDVNDKNQVMLSDIISNRTERQDVSDDLLVFFDMNDDYYKNLKIVKEMDDNAVSNINNTMNEMVVQVNKLKKRSKKETT